MLNLLIEAVAAGTSFPRFDPAAFRRERNAARKLRHLAAMTSLPPIDRARLRAIGRVRACLFHCDGTIHSTALRADLGAAAGNIGQGPFSEAKLAVTATELCAICDFYGVVAASLLASALPPLG